METLGDEIVQEIESILPAVENDIETIVIPNAEIIVIPLAEGVLIQLLP